MSIDTLPQAPLTTDRVTRWLLFAVGVYSIFLVVILNLIVLTNGKLHGKAIFMMADGMILLWVIVGGSLTPIMQKRLVPRLTAIPIGWRLRFVILCTIMALIEEVITTTMTNLAPVFGTTPEEAHITASTNYFKVVLFHSVVVIVPMFVAWALMLSRWNFSPLKVLLLFGITGLLAEGNQLAMSDGRLLGLRLRADDIPPRLHGSCGSGCQGVAMVALSDGRLPAVPSRGPSRAGSLAGTKVAWRAVLSRHKLIMR